jgi:hypothetical protein
MSSQSQVESSNLHYLSDKWVLWAHLPHDTNWSINSYIKISTINSIEEMIELTQCLKESLIKNCMLFIMKENINPTWEDKNNIDGGCFSIKINNKSVSSTWKNITYLLMGNTLSNNKEFMKQINGITISPKKTFCIIKIWTRTCKYTESNLFSTAINIQSDNIIFKKHNNK